MLSPDASYILGGKPVGDPNSTLKWHRGVHDTNYCNINWLKLTDCVSGVTNVNFLDFTSNVAVMQIHLKCLHMTCFQGQSDMTKDPDNHKNVLVFQKLPVTSL